MLNNLIFQTYDISNRPFSKSISRELLMDSLFKTNIHTLSGNYPVPPVWEVKYCIISNSPVFHLDILTRLLTFLTRATFIISLILSTEVI